MVVIAHLVSRVEALVLVSALEAAAARRAGIVGAWLCRLVPAYLAGLIAGAISVFQALLFLPLHAASLPVNPQGRGEYFLAAAGKPPG
jgi:hypothetical protein